MMSGEGVDPFSQIWVIGRLSVINMIRFAFQLCPHMNAAVTIAKSSLKSIDIFWHLGGHLACVHECL